MTEEKMTLWRLIWGGVRRAFGNGYATKDDLGRLERGVTDRLDRVHTSINRMGETVGQLAGTVGQLAGTVGQLDKRLDRGDEKLVTHADLDAEIVKHALDCPVRKAGRGEE